MFIYAYPPPLQKKKKKEKKKGGGGGTGGGQIKINKHKKKLKKSGGYQHYRTEVFTLKGQKITLTAASTLKSLRKSHC